MDIPALIAQTGLEPDPLGDLDHDLGVLDEELLRVLAALPELLALVRVPGTGLLHDAQVDLSTTGGDIGLNAIVQGF